jgi:hypothetical protein
MIVLCDQRLDNQYMPADRLGLDSPLESYTKRGGSGLILEGRGVRKVILHSPQGRSSAAGSSIYFPQRN